MKQRRKIKLAEGEIGPTPERLVQGNVEQLDHTIADEIGRPARPFRAFDTLSLMLRRNTITPAMYQAAEDFRRLFYRAALDPLRVPDLARVRAASSASALPPTLRQEEARRKVWAALIALGGIASPAGSCVWHVVGCEWTVKDWARRQGWGGRPLDPDVASGVLIGALGALQAHFGLA